MDAGRGTLRMEIERGTLRHGHWELGHAMDNGEGH